MDINGGNYLKLTSFCQPEDGHHQNSIFWYYLSENPAVADALEFVANAANTFQSEVAPKVTAFMSSQTYWTGTEASVSLDGNVFVGSTFAPHIPGEIDGDSLPNYAAAIIQKRTATPGKTGRGRWYFGCLAEPITNGATLNEDGQTALVGLAEILIEPLALDGGITATPAHLMGSGGLADILAVHPLITLGTLRRRMVRPRF